MPQSDNWVVNLLQSAFNMWNNTMTDIWTLISQSPQEFKGGEIWAIMTDINGALKTIAFSLLVLFFAVSVFSSTLEFRHFKNWQTSLKFFIKFILAKTAIAAAMDIMLMIFNIANGAIGAVSENLRDMSELAVTLPQEIQTSIETTGFLASIPLWIVSLLGCLIITVLSFVMLLTVYGRFFRLFLYTAVSPLPLSTFAGGHVAKHVGETFVKSYAGVCLEGLVVVVCCIIFSAFAGTNPVTIDGDLPAVNAVWQYIIEVSFNMLVLVGMIKGSNTVVKSMFGL